jgi:hypothetical protein
VRPRTIRDMPNRNIQAHLLKIWNPALGSTASTEPSWLTSAQYVKFIANCVRSNIPVLRTALVGHRVRSSRPDFMLVHLSEDYPASGPSTWMLKCWQTCHDGYEASEGWYKRVNKLRAGGRRILLCCRQKRKSSCKLQTDFSFPHSCVGD